MNEISRKLYIVRVLHNFTQAYVAEQIGISPSAYIAMELGQTNVHHERLEAVLSIYSISVNNFFAFSEKDILNVLKGKSLVSRHLEPSFYPQLVAKLEAINQMLFHMLQGNMELARLQLRQGGRK